MGSRSDAMENGEVSGSADSNVNTAAGSSHRTSVPQAPAVDTGTYISELHLWCACRLVRCNILVSTASSAPLCPCAPCRLTARPTHRICFLYKREGLKDEI